MLREYRRIKNEDERQAGTLFGEFKSRLERHMLWEEDILFPRVEANIGMNLPAPSIRARSQHREIKRVVDELYKQLVGKQKRTDELEKELEDMWDEHDREEERILYAWIDLSLSEEEKQKALDLMSRSSVKEERQ